MAICANQVYKSVPVGENFVLSFDTTKDCMPIALEQLCSATVVLYDATRIQLGTEELDTVIKTFTMEDYPALFSISNDNQQVVVTVLWVFITDYIAAQSLNEFKGEVYAELHLAGYGENAGYLDIAPVGLGSLTGVAAILMDYGIIPASIKSYLNAKRVYLHDQDEPDYAGDHYTVDSLNIEQSVTLNIDTDINQHIQNLQVIQTCEATISICDENLSFGPLMVVIGSDRYLLPTSPYQSNSEQLPVDSFTEGTEPVIQRTIYDMSGTPLNINSMEVRYVVKEINSGEHLFDIKAAILNGSQGEVQIFIPKELINTPGMYLSAFQIFNNDGVLLYQMPRYLEVLPNYRSGYSTRPLTIAEVRLFLKDYPDLNSLFEEVEFSDQEIAFALIRPIDVWNSMPPNLGIITPGQFAKYRGAWLWGTLSELLAMASNYYRREQLAYSAAGLSIDDKNKADAYMTASEQYNLKFREFVDRTKAELNIMGGFLFMGGPYSTIWGG